MRIINRYLSRRSALKFVLTTSFFLFLTVVSGIFEARLCSTFLPSREAVANPVAKKKSPGGNSNQNGMNFFAPVSMELSEVELQTFLERYSELYEFPFFIDRRVDPTTLVSGSYTDVPLVSALADILERVDLSYCVVDNVFLYVGPKQAAGEALLLFYLKRAQLFEEYPRQIAEKLGATIDFEIQPYSEPQSSFQALAKRSRLKFSGFEKTPFDLWRGVALKNVTVADVLTVMTIGFNVDYQYESSSGSIKPTSLNRRQKVMRFYPKEYAAKIKKKDHPNCSFHETTYENEPSICVTGFFEEVALVEYEFFQIWQEELSEQAKPAHSTESTSKSTKNSRSNNSSSTHAEVTGTVSNKTLNDLFAYLKKNTKITCVLDDSLASTGVTLDTRVTCEFNHSDVNDIASIIASKINAKATINGETIVFSKK
ncbi:MAG: hypothetical protein IK077_14550 [Thermoguttaceae bacterium]|nr:hypothetical protein [Thermoguttaceae bacterium]